MLFAAIFHRLDKSWSLETLDFVEGGKLENPEQNPGSNMGSNKKLDPHTV